MRKAVPILTDELTKEQFLDIIVESLQTVIFATIDDNDHARSNAADIELRDGEKLVFSTIVNGPFYNRLKKHPYISITGLKGEETMNSVAFTVNGEVEEVDSSYLEKIYETHPEMKDIDNTDPDSSKATLRPFAITPIDGQVYDLRNGFFRKHFDF
ncbi:hypothetical protein [Lactobacillus ultunensis]|uniref:Pyridoxamine 5'-phosphate oxidase family protein n=1 Tax=Lactobacillus ultunensis DSM 16047 TaxID=525365 RepID=C2ENG2_9LACO|nr:hypothetical protein [Lactobacillus ultunensis]EEJ71966.1 hypothetical protein HMPREF0548_1208 [Lactobacillus ultunensis DSM 16047]KRL82007.1 hypothetical protein FC57_GL000245 [Lactobacillus ultunensis DSM 16047]QQP27631.1 pyridoxamine 5'-phosphate oxidase family protein [Lactobacillus ultunensis]